MPEIHTLMEMDNAMDWSGYGQPRRVGGHEADLNALIGLMENRDGIDGIQWLAKVQEAMTTSTFPNMFGDAVARDLISHYKAVTPNLIAILRRRSAVTDFRTIKTFRKGGFLTRRMQVVPEKGEYKAAEIEIEQTTYALKKYGKQVDFSWEAFLNDDLGMFSDIGQDLAQSAINTENSHITSLFFAAAGPIAGTFGNAAAATAALTIGSLETGVEAMNAYTHPDTGEPIMNAPKFLMVPPSLEFTARQILTSANKMWVFRGDDEAGPLPLPTTNVISQIGLQLIVNPWLPIINTTNGATAWALFSDPTQIAAGEISFLAGRESPEIWLKSSNAVQVGGGVVSPFAGDFATDNIFYRIRHVFQGSAVEPRAAYASLGTT
jgi:hypothetical protein